MNEKKEAFADVVLESGRTAWLAGLGTVVTIEEGAERLLHNTRKELKENVTRIADEAQDRFQHLVERGRAYQEERTTRKMEMVDAMEEGTEAVESMVVRVTHRTQTAIRSTVENLLQRLNVPTRDEIRALTEQIDRLQTEIELLRSTHRGEPA